MNGAKYTIIIKSENFNTSFNEGIWSKGYPLDALKRPNTQI